MTIIDKFVILATLVGVLGMSTVQPNRPATTVQTIDATTSAETLHCCAWCTEHPEYCENGCNPDCFFDY